MRYKYNIAYVYMWMYDLLGISRNCIKEREKAG